MSVLCALTCVLQMDRKKLPLSPFTVKKANLNSRGHTMNVVRNELSTHSKAWTFNYHSVKPLSHTGRIGSCSPLYLPAACLS
jgi:hypothetical protein